MEVKIKTDKGMVDATIKMVDGVMVVSPEYNYEPKDGDIVAIYNIGLDVWMPAIYKVSDPICGATVYCIYNGNKKLRVNRTGIEICNGIRLANEEERLFLLDALESDGYEWDAEKKEVRKVLKFKKAQDVFYPAFRPYYGELFAPRQKTYIDSDGDKNLIKMGYLFANKEECDELCEKLNEKIKEVEP